MTPFVRIDRWDQIPDAIAKMQAAGVNHRIPLMQALYRGRIAHLEVGRTGYATRMKRWQAALCVPGLLLLGDDDHAAPDGPDTWPIARKAIAWARFILLHGAVGRAEHYEMAVTLTRQFGRLLMIECSSANLGAWKAATEQWGRGAEGQIICPAPGQSHPTLNKSELH